MWKWNFEQVKKKNFRALIMLRYAQLWITHKSIHSIINTTIHKILYVQILCIEFFGCDYKIWHERSNSTVVEHSKIWRKTKDNGCFSVRIQVFEYLWVCARAFIIQRNWWEILIENCGKDSSICLTQRFLFRIDSMYSVCIERNDRKRHTFFCPFFRMCLLQRGNFMKFLVNCVGYNVFDKRWTV